MRRYWLTRSSHNTCDYNCLVVQEQPASLEVVYRSDWRGCAAQALALEAAGIPYAIQERPGEFAIVVDAVNAARARDELDAYAEENPVALPQIAGVDRSNGWIGTVGYAAVLAVITALQENHLFSHDWYAAGRLNAGLVRGGEVWRAFTALTLHQDLAHFLSNVFIGGLIGLFVGQLLGSGLAWISILLAGAAGNLVSASFRPAGYTAIGASTAVFAALGILAAYEWTRRRNLRASMLIRYAPIVGGVVLLSYLGTGGERTDVISHVTGFLCGLTLGALYGKLGQRIAFNRAGQIALSLAAVALLALSWSFALSG